ncbi:hypothetical protein G6F47_012635 [Rhizopus delemar]|nr:hypothetical protein G6F49_012888 [Rhizopus delemar]KAG1580474.1 hypothetical protein G6F47_012635 [Rhizopus delemar]
MEYYNMDWSTAYFQHDGDPKHRSKSTVQWLQANGVNYIDDWPAQSPDLNPIEHLWHHLKLKLSLYDKKAKGVHELWERVEKEWNSFDKEVCIRQYNKYVVKFLHDLSRCSFFTHCSSRTAADIFAELHIYPSPVYRYTKKLKVNVSSSQLGRPTIVDDVTKT